MGGPWGDRMGREPFVGQEGKKTRAGEWRERVFEKQKQDTARGVKGKAVCVGNCPMGVSQLGCGETRSKLFRTSEGD